jgi:hypothetical protein
LKQIFIKLTFEITLNPKSFYCIFTRHHEACFELLSAFKDRYSREDVYEKIIPPKITEVVRRLLSSRDEICRRDFKKVFLRRLASFGEQNEDTEGEVWAERVSEKLTNLITKVEPKP